MRAVRAAAPSPDSSGPSPADQFVSVAASRKPATFLTDGGGGGTRIDRFPAGGDGRCVGRHVEPAAERNGDVLAMHQDVGERLQAGDAEVVPA